MAEQMFETSKRLDDIENIIDKGLNSVMEDFDDMIIEFSKKERGYLLLYVKDLEFGSEMKIDFQLAYIPRDSYGDNVKEDWLDKIDRYDPKSTFIVNCVVVDNDIVHSKWMVCSKDKQELAKLK